MIKANKLNLFELFKKRKMAYVRVFDKSNVFTSQVLEDLCVFCRAHETTYHPDGRMHALLEGRREVLLRILNYLNLTEDEIYRLHVVHNQPKGE